MGKKKINKQATKMVEAKAKKAKAKAELAPKVKLRLIGPKPLTTQPADPSSGETPDGSGLTLTPPPEVSAEALQAAVNSYLLTQGRAPPVDPSDSEESETEAYLKSKQQKQGIFSKGMDAEGEEEEELEEDELETEEDEPPHKKHKKVAADETEDEEGEDDDEESENETESETDAAFPLKLSVPFDGANTSLTVQSDLPFKDVRVKLANTMSLPPKDVHVGYRFSLQPRSTPWTHLSNNAHWMELVEAARTTKATTQSKKEFFVELKDLEAAKGKGSAAAGKNAKKDKKDKKRVCCAVAHGVLLLIPPTQKRRDSDDDSAADSEIDGEKVKKKKSLPQWVVELERENACIEHGGHGCIKYTTGHAQLTKSDLSTWALFLQSGYASLTTPPPKLQAMPSFGYPGFSPYWMPPPFPAMTPASNTRRAEQLSSPPEPMEDNRLFPRITDWLGNLDKSESRGADGHNFLQFVFDFQRERYVRLLDLEHLSVQDLKELSPEMATGTASKLLAYAKADIKKIRKDEKRRMRQEAQHGARYT
ncbi:hypothetical protein R3P38DRAFT_2772057 [Favolaschia claudopus]|uniref:Uncharacterized protein n=1 Tax=Favolaschia claudopus TaxID=2862362 RepID=A0AAW0C939_9AGAR